MSASLSLTDERFLRALDRLPEFRAFHEKKQESLRLGLTIMLEQSDGFLLAPARDGAWWLQAPSSQLKRRTPKPPLAGLRAMHRLVAVPGQPIHGSAFVRPGTKCVDRSVRSQIKHAGTWIDETHPTLARVVRVENFNFSRSGHITYEGDAVIDTVAPPDAEGKLAAHRDFRAAKSQLAGW